LLLSSIRGKVIKTKGVKLMEINHKTKIITIDKKFESMEVSIFNKDYDFKIITELIKKGYEIIYI